MIIRSREAALFRRVFDSKPLTDLQKSMLQVLYGAYPERMTLDELAEGMGCSRGSLHGVLGTLSVRIPRGEFDAMKREGVLLLSRKVDVFLRRDPYDWDQVRLTAAAFGVLEDKGWGRVITPI